MMVLGGGQRDVSEMMKDRNLTVVQWKRPLNVGNSPSLGGNSGSR